MSRAAPAAAARRGGGGGFQINKEIPTTHHCCCTCTSRAQTIIVSSGNCRRFSGFFCNITETNLRRFLSARRAVSPQTATASASSPARARPIDRPIDRFASKPPSQMPFIGGGNEQSAEHIRELGSIRTSVRPSVGGICDAMPNAVAAAVIIA